MFNDYIHLMFLVRHINSLYAILRVVVRFDQKLIFFDNIFALKGERNINVANLFWVYIYMYHVL